MIPLPAPRFDLAREPTWALRLGLGFFSLLSLGFLGMTAILVSTFFYEPKPRPRPIPDDLDPGVAEVMRRAEERIREVVPPRQHAPARDRLRWITSVGPLGVAMIPVTVLPIARELRRRKREEERAAVAEAA